MQAVILAGGTSAQLHPWTPCAPKPLLPFFDRPVIEHIIRLLARHEIRDLIIATSPQSRDIARHFGTGSHLNVNIRYSIENEPAGTAGAVRRLGSMISDSFLVISSDIVTDLDISAAIRAHESSGSLATVLVHTADDPTRFGTVSYDQENRITRFVEKPRSTEIFSDTVSAGIYILQPEVISSIAPFVSQDFARDTFPLLLRNGDPISACHLPGYWCDLGDALQYRNAHFDALQGKLQIDLPAVYAGEGIWVGDGVDVHPSAQLAAPVFIGSGASIGRDVVIGGNTILGANARIQDGASIARSVIGGSATIWSDTEVANTVIVGELAAQYVAQRRGSSMPDSIIPSPTT